MKNKAVSIFDKTFAVIFAVAGIAAAYGVIIKGAWWHIISVAIAAAITTALIMDAKKEDNP